MYTDYRLGRPNGNSGENTVPTEAESRTIDAGQGGKTEILANAMVMRQQQFEALRKSRMDSFTRRVSRSVRGHLPSQTQAYTEEELFAEVDSQIQRARSAGLKSEADLASFVGFRFMAGADFRSQSRFSAIWDRSDLEGSVKVARTRELLSAPGPESRV